MGVWESVIAGAIAAGSAYVSSKNAKKQAEGVHDQWEDRMRWEEEKVARKQNSMGGKAAPYIMEQMLRVYGDQSKGRGGFTLPVDEMIANMGIKERQSGTYKGGSGYNVPGTSGMSSKSKQYARDQGTDYVIGRTDPEVDGYNGKDWERGGLVDGDQFGVFREPTRGTGNVTTQTERGYTTITKPLGPGSPMTSTEKLPNLYGDLATGGDAGFVARDLPPDVIKKFGLAALKVGMSVFVPSLGTVINVAGKIKQKVGQSDGKQSFWETFAGINDKDYGRFTKSDGFLSKLFSGINRNEQDAVPQPTRLGRGD